MTTNIFSQIKEFEKKAEEIAEKANREKELILQKARLKASDLLEEKEELIEKNKEKKVNSYMEKLKESREKKISEGKEKVDQLKKESSKKIAKAVDFVLEKFEEMM